VWLLKTPTDFKINRYGEAVQHWYMDAQQARKHALGRTSRSPRLIGFPMNLPALFNLDLVRPVRLSHEITVNCPELTSLYSYARNPQAGVRFYNRRDKRCSALVLWRSPARCKSLLQLQLSDDPLSRLPTTMTRTARGSMTLLEITGYRTSRELTSRDCGFVSWHTV
jgi:hypothetical protein